MAEKSYSPAPTAFAPYLDAVTSLFHPVAGPVYNASARFHGWKETMGLVQPGTVENLTREVSRECRMLATCSSCNSSGLRSDNPVRMRLLAECCCWHAAFQG